MSEILTFMAECAILEIYGIIQGFKANWVIG